MSMFLSRFAGHSTHDETLMWTWPKCDVLTWQWLPQWRQRPHYFASMCKQNWEQWRQEEENLEQNVPEKLRGSLLTFGQTFWKSWIKGTSPGTDASCTSCTAGMQRMRHCAQPHARGDTKLKQQKMVDPEHYVRHFSDCPRIPPHAPQVSRVKGPFNQTAPLPPSLGGPATGQSVLFCKRSSVEKWMMWWQFQLKWSFCTPQSC